MYFPIKQLASDVAAILGESLASDCPPEETHFPFIEERVRLMSPLILEELLMQAEVEELCEVKSLNVSVTVDSLGMVTIVLPDDFLRLVSVKMSDWKRQVCHITPSDSEHYLWQTSRWEGIRGSPERPLALLGRNLSGERCMRLFSSGQDASLDHLLYIARPKLYPSDLLEVPDNFYNILVCRVAEAIKKL